MSVQRKKTRLSNTRKDVMDRLSRGYEMERLGMTPTEVAKALGYSQTNGWSNMKRAHEAKVQKALAARTQIVDNPLPRLPMEENALVEKICMAFRISRDDLDSMIDLYLSVKTGV